VVIKGRQAIMINTLVLSGAGYDMVYEFGIAAELQRHYNFYLSPDIGISKGQSKHVYRHKHDHEHEIKSRTKYIFGTSAGSIVGLAIAVGWDLDELITKLVLTVSNRKIYSGSLVLSILTLPYYSYLFDTDIRYDVLEIILSKIGQNATFADLDHNIDLTMVATELVTGATILFSKANTPNVELKTAALASSSIPIAFKPIYINKLDVKEFIEGGLPVSKIQDKFHVVDGGFSCVYPIAFVPDINTTIGVCIIYNYDNNPSDGLLSMISHSISLGSFNFYQQSSVVPKLDRDRTLLFHVSKTTLGDYVGVLTKPHMEQMINLGRGAAIDFLYSR